MNIEKGTKHKHKHEYEREPSAQNQYIAAIVVNLSIIGYALHEGWSSPAVIALQSNDSPLPITKNELTWATTLLPIGGVIGNLFYAYATNYFGRKTLLLFNAIPIIISWLLILFARHVFYLYVSRFLGGFFGAPSMTIATLLLSEIANDRVRGILTSSLFFSEYFGIWLAYMIGSFDLNAVAIFAIILLVGFVILFLFFPDSGLFFVKCDKISNAEKSVRFYKSISERNENSGKILNLEMDKLKAIIADAQQQSVNESQASLKWSDFTTKAARKAIIIGIVLVVICILNGVTTYYTAEIFEETGSTLSSNLSAIITGIVPVIAVGICMYLVDRVGRKPLMSVSGLGTALGLAVLAVYMMLKTWNIPVETVNWIPLASYSFAYFTASLGIQTLTFPIISEIMPEKIKNTAVSFCMTFSSILQILISKYLLFFIEALGFHWAMFVFAGICLFGTLYIQLSMPETKGKCYVDIMRALEK